MRGISRQSKPSLVGLSGWLFCWFALTAVNMYSNWSHHHMFFAFHSVVVSPAVTLWSTLLFAGVWTYWEPKEDMQMRIFPNSSLFLKESTLHKYSSTLQVNRIYGSFSQWQMPFVLKLGFFISFSFLAFFFGNKNDIVEQNDKTDFFLFPFEHESFSIFDKSPLRFQ